MVQRASQVDRPLAELEGNAGRVLRYVVQHPGCHLRQIRRGLRISMGTTQYHLRRLERTGRITSTKRGLLKHFFGSATFQSREKILLEVLTRETERGILMFIMERRNPTQSDIADRLGLSAPSVSWHMKRLVQSGVVLEAREGKYKRYELRGDPQSLVTLMKEHYPSVWDVWSDRLAELFLSLAREGGDQA